MPRLIALVSRLIALVSLLCQAWAREASEARLAARASLGSGSAEELEALQASEARRLHAVEQARMTWRQLDEKERQKLKTRAEVMLLQQFWWPSF